MTPLSDKLANAKVKDLSGGGTYLIDKADTSELYTDIKAGKYFIPAGDTLISKTRESLTMFTSIREFFINF